MTNPSAVIYLDHAATTPVKPAALQARAVSSIVAVGLGLTLAFLLECTDLPLRGVVRAVVRLDRPQG